MNNSRINNFIFKDNFIPQDMCAEAVNDMSSMKWTKHSWTATNKPFSQGDKEPEVCSDQTPLHKVLQIFSSNAFSEYMQCINTHNKFINRFSNVRLNKYPVGTYMSPHIDHITSLFDGENRGIPVLSLIGLLNNDFEGGELIFWDDHHIQLKTGDIVIFPSNFMYPHEIKKVTKGIRHSFVCWAW